MLQVESPHGRTAQDIRAARAHVTGVLRASCTPRRAATKPTSTGNTSEHHDSLRHFAPAQPPPQPPPTQPQPRTMPPRHSRRPKPRHTRAAPAPRYISPHRAMPPTTLVAAQLPVPRGNLALEFSVNGRRARHSFIVDVRAPAAPVFEVAICGQTTPNGAVEVTRLDERWVILAGHDTKIWFSLVDLEGAAGGKEAEEAPDGGEEVRVLEIAGLKKVFRSVRGVAKIVQLLPTARVDYEVVVTRTQAAQDF
ncbi:hypothetical protein EDC01DRAFT_777567 [Geopyxis carbonaria]|nr:hypothetical protein EDC01DRAFT_777567 [Geopyxis carbonaria]